MNNYEMFGQAKWVAPKEECSGPYIIGNFNVSNIKSANITICGLGFFELYINNKRVSDDLLVPVNSQYEYRDLRTLSYPIQDTISYRIYCLNYDILPFLREGKNTIGVILGNGWYNQNMRKEEGNVSYGRIKLCFKIELIDQSGNASYFYSDESLKWAQSEVVFNNIYLGEEHDYSFCRDNFSSNDFDDSSWKSVEIVPAPDSNFFIQKCPADKIIKKVSPKLIKELESSNIYDVGEAITGFAEIVPISSGDITVKYAEELNDDYTLSFDSTGGDNRIQKDIFKNTTIGDTYYPKFTWHGFRFFELSKNAKPKDVCIVHSDCPVTSSFESDNDVLNWLYKAYLRTQLNNMHCGVPSDCPHIERLGYTGDGQLCAEAVMLMTDSREFYRKWLEDISDCQDINNGHVQHTAPFGGGGGGPAGWGGAIVVVPYMFYKCYGEKDVLECFLPKMLKYFDYMVSRSENGLVVREEDGGWCLGDWCSPVEYSDSMGLKVKSRVLIPEPYVNTTLFIKFMKTAIEISEIIGKPEMTSHLPDIIDNCTKAVNNAYYSSMYGSYSGDVQGANSFAIDCDIADKKVLKSTVEKYQKRGMLDTGIFATDTLLRVLFESGNAQLAYDLLTSKGDISFYYMMTHGATTLWEDWHPERSLNHPMFGPCTRYLFTYLLGIGQEKDSAGFEKVVISPCLVNGLNYVKGHITTVKGKIEVAINRKNGKTFITVNLENDINAVFKNGENVFKLHAGENKIELE